jgi:hypothetical protein
MFIIQCGLLGFFVSELNGNGKDKNPDKVEFGYWLVGILMQLYTSHQQLGPPYNREYWAAVLNMEPEMAKQPIWLYDKIKVTYGIEWRLRSCMDLLISSVARDIIMFTFPIMLCVEGPLDFVKDCTAVFFLTTIDDLEFANAKTMEQMVTRLKFNIFYDHLQKNRGTDLEMPLKFTPKEAASAIYDANSWDQFEKQRSYESPYITPRMPLLDYMLENSKCRVVTKSFQPGELGFNCDDDGRVEEVDPGRRSQAEALGVEVGWRVVMVGELQFSRERLSNHRTGNKAFSITFDLSEVADQTGPVNPTDELPVWKAQRVFDEEAPRQRVRNEEARQAAVPPAAVPLLTTVSRS